MTSNAIILAGGKATRLGPLAAQLNKCLVTVGQQPMLVHQVNAFRKRDVDHVTVVTSPESRSQVESLALHAFNGKLVHVVPQTRGNTPIDALLDGIAFQLECGRVGPTYVISADTLIEVPEYDPLDWAHVVKYDGDQSRSWTVLEANGKWGDRPAYPGEYIYTGLARHQSNVEVYGTLAPARQVGARLTTSYALNATRCGPFVHEFLNWQDVGDLPALAAARRTQYVARAEHRLELDGDGVVWKYGDVGDEIAYYNSLPRIADRLFPRTFTVPSREDKFGIEHIDQPTLSELWLYWPGSVNMWVDILSELCERVDRTLWSRDIVPPDRPSDISDGCHVMYVKQLNARMQRWAHPILSRNHIIINGQSYIAGTQLLADLVPAAHELVTAWRPGLIHGDLSFMNILWSITTSQPKLLDPRGRWGKKRTTVGDVRYDLAKLRYSYHGGCAAILHGLFDLDSSMDWSDHKFTLTPVRLGDHEQLDAVLERYWPLSDIKLIEAIQCLSGSALHQANERESIALYLRGVQLANEALRELA